MKEQISQQNAVVVRHDKAVSADSSDHTQSSPKAEGASEVSPLQARVEELENLTVALHNQLEPVVVENEEVCDSISLSVCFG